MDRKYKVLFVDDNAVDRAYVQGILSHEGFEVVLAINANEGFEKALNEHVDLIILDIILPGVSGIVLCHKFKTNEQLKNIPVVFFTSVDIPKEFINYKESGALDYFHKTIAPQELVQRLKLILQAKK